MLLRSEFSLNQGMEQSVARSGLSPVARVKVECLSRNSAQSGAGVRVSMCQGPVHQLYQKYKYWRLPDRLPEPHGFCHEVEPALVKGCLFRCTFPRKENE